MAKELKDYTISELSRELRNRNHVAVIIWLDDDIKEALIDNEVKATEGNIQKVWDRMSHWLKDGSIERGWEIIADTIAEINWDGEFEA